MTPLDILLQVLSRLPAKSLLRFKCVSKYWHSLIIHPSFIDLYQSQSGKLLVVSPRNLSKPPYRWDRRFYIIDSKNKPTQRVTVHDPRIPFTTNAVTNIVNGLVCFYHDYDEEACMHIYNLTTHEDLPVPPSPRRGAARRQCHLGFDPINKEYKLILLYWWNKYCKGGGGCHVLTIMGRDNAWRPIDISIFPLSIFARDTGFCHDGILYWARYTDCTYQTALGRLIAFHVEQEKMEYITYTQEETPPSGEPSVCLVEGRLSVVHTPRQREGNTDVVITLWRQIDRNDNGRPLWTKDVITCPFQNYVRGYVRCTHFGLVSLVTCCRKSEFASIECCNLTTKKHMVLKVNNAQGFLSPEYDEHCSPFHGFRPALLVKNIMPLKSNNVTERPVLGL